MNAESNTAVINTAKGMSLIMSALRKAPKTKKGYCGVCGENLPADVEHLTPCSRKCREHQLQVLKRKFSPGVKECEICGKSKAPRETCIDCILNMQ